MRRSLAAGLMVAASVWAPSAAAQDEVSVGDVRLAALDTMCWSSSQAPCEGVGRVDLHVRTALSPVRVRVIAVELEREGAWARATDLRLTRRSDRVRTQPPHRREPAVDIARRTTDTLHIHFELVRVYETRVRITLEVGGRRVTLHARHSVVSESPDPSF